MKKNVISVIFLLNFGFSLFASPAAINFKNISLDNKYVKLVDDFLSVFSSISYYDFQNKDKKTPEMKKAYTLYKYLIKKENKNYDEELLTLLTMRCLYNFDKVSFPEVEECFNEINKKYSENAEQNWIYGNFLVSTSKIVEGKKSLEKYMQLKNYYINQAFIDDYTYAQFMCATPLHAYYTLTNSMSISEEEIQNQQLLNMIKSNILESSSSEQYKAEDVWKVGKDEEGHFFISSTMLGVSLPIKGHWNVNYFPFSSKSAAMCQLAIKDFTLNNLPLGITIMTLIFPESMYNDAIEKALVKSLNIVKKESVEISKKDFTKYTYEDLSKYNDERKGSRGYLFTSKIIPNKFSGIRCEKPVDISSIINQKNSDNDDSESRFFRFSPSYKRLNEPVNVLILVDSCNAKIKETDILLEELFEKAIFE